MKLYLRLAALVIVAIALVSCQERIQPIYNSENISIPNSLAFTSLAEIGKSIMQAGAKQNWKMTDMEPGKIRGVLDIRAHQATVRIDYSLISYSITYVSSVNLKDVGYGIHKNYNSWIRDLESAINVQLLDRSLIANNESLNAQDKSILEAWKLAERSDDAQVLQNFLDRYGNSPFASLAQDRLDILAQQRTSGIRRFDPTGNWRTTVRYLRGADNISACPNSGRWDFVLNFQRGKFSQTHWDGKLPLYIEGQNFDDFVDLKLNGPLYSGEFNWTERFRLDSNEGRFEATANGACPGTMKLYMRKE